ncbi:hypothetical protein Leryth_023607 [Lithospermum erythrorhizon]|nr:hypothetical protein Leryth_023607 [Lithospermum erythrorhizon]
MRPRSLYRDYDYFQIRCPMKEKNITKNVPTAHSSLWVEKGDVLKAICAGFEETTEPGVCLSDGKFLLPALDKSLFKMIMSHTMHHSYSLYEELDDIEY